jgi:hypothetical protein
MNGERRSLAIKTASELRESDKVQDFEIHNFCSLQGSIIRTVKSRQAGGLTSLSPRHCQGLASGIHKDLVQVSKKF